MCQTLGQHAAISHDHVLTEGQVITNKPLRKKEDEDYKLSARATVFHWPTLENKSQWIYCLTTSSQKFYTLYLWIPSAIDIL